MAKQLSGAQKFALGEWVRKHGEQVTNRDIFWDALVQMAQDELKFPISESSMRFFCDIVYPNRQPKRRPNTPDGVERMKHAREGKGIEIQKRILFLVERIAQDLNIK